MHKCSAFIKTSFTYTVWAVTVPPLLGVCGILALLPARLRYDNRLYFVISTFVGRLIITATGTSFVIHGKENLPAYPQQPAIIVMNHSSALDIPMAEIVVGSYPHVWISKSSYGKIPLFGFLLKRMHVMVDTTARRDAAAALIRTHALLKNASRHVLIFPEGTRSSDGKIGTFLPGFALLAKKLNRPVIPITMTNMHKLYPKNTWLIDSDNHHVTITIGKPLHCPADMEPAAFAALVQDHCEHELNK
jgi:1-acyl-sn-glycerol-3-phosphate acyltransferase